MNCLQVSGWGHLIFLQTSKSSSFVALQKPSFEGWKPAQHLKSGKASVGRCGMRCAPVSDDETKRKQDFGSEVPAVATS